MSFADEAENENRAGYLGRGCGVGVLLAQLDPDLKAEVLHVLLDRPDISATAIRRALTKYDTSGKIPSAYTIQRHRREVCNCAPT